MVDRRVTVVIGADAGPFIRGLAAAGTAAKAFSKELNTSNDRMTNLTQSAIALAPTIAPIAGAATVAVMGLSSSFASAAGAAGVAVLAFQGIGDALKSVNDYALDPTDAHLKAMKLSMEQLSPVGREFVMFLQNDMRPEIQALQDVAQRGLLPGVQGGLQQLLDLGPRVEKFVSNFSVAMGHLASDAGAELAGPEFQEFFNYISDEGPHLLDEFARSIGNFMKGIAGLFTAFSGVSHDFSEAMLNASRDFAEWGQNLDKSQGFQSFVSYVEEHGPEVWRTLEAIGGMLKGLVEAMAPIGPVALTGIRGLADVIGAIADSNAGPVLVGIAAGLSAISRAIAFKNILGGPAITALFGATGLGGAAKAAKDLPAAARGLTMFGAAAGTTAATASELTASSDRLKTSFKGVGQLAAGAAGAFLLINSAGRETTGTLNGLEKVAGGALAGLAVGGVWGAALGAGAGLMYGLATSTSEAAEAVKALRTNLSETPTDFTATFHGLETVNAELLRTNELVQASEDVSQNQAASMGRSAVAVAGASAEYVRYSDTLTDVQRQALGAAQAMSDLSEATGGGRIAVTDVEALEQAAERLGPAFEQAGVDLNGLLAERGMAKAWGRNGLIGSMFGDVADMHTEEAIAKLKAYVRETDSVAGRTNDVTSAFRDLSDGAILASDSAEDLGLALQMLGGGAIDADQAAFAYQESLESLAEDLDKTGRLTLQNKTAIGERVEALKASIAADANAGASARELGEKLRNQRQALLDVAAAQGLSREATTKLLKTYGLVPSMITTVIEQAKMQEARTEAKKLVDAYNELPREVRVAISELGGDVTEETLKGLREQGINLSKQEIKMILAAQDNASVKISKVKAELNDLNVQHPTPKLDADPKPGMAQIDKVNARLNALDESETNPKVGLDDREARKKVAYLINNVLNKGLRTAFNMIADFTDAPTLDPMSAQFTGHGAQLARGGILPGFRPVQLGDDRYVKMRSGEGVYVSEAMRDEYERERLRKVNKAALEGRSLKPYQQDGPEGYKSGGVVWPTVGRQTSTYAGHDGVDINSPPGPDSGAPTWAFRDGTVTTTGYDRGYGNAVFLGTSVGEVVYGHHLDGSIRVHSGQRVTAGTQLANVGSTGNSSGPHLHFGFPGGTYAAAMAALQGAMTVHGGAYGVDPGMPPELRKKIQAIIDKVEDDIKTSLAGDGGFTQSLNTQGMRGVKGVQELLDSASSGAAGIYSGDHSGLLHASPATAQSYAHSIVGKVPGWGEGQWPYWLDLGNRESGWRWNATNPTSGAYGIPQSLPPTKMASAGPDWHDNAGTQIDWMASYIKATYGTPAAAIAHHNAYNWYDEGGMWKGGVGYNGTGKPEAVLTPDETRMFRAGMAALVEMAKKAKSGGGGGYLGGGGGGGGGNGPHPHHGSGSGDGSGNGNGNGSGDGNGTNTLIEQLIKNLEKRYGKDSAIVAAMTEWLQDAELKNGAFGKELQRLTREFALQATKGFNIKDKMDASGVKSEIDVVLDALKAAFGKQSSFYKNAERIGDRLIKEAKERDELREELRKEKDQLKSLQQAQKDYAGEVAGNFKSDLFAEGNTLADAFLQGHADANDAKEFERLLRKARRLGLDGKTFKLLAASGNLQLIDELDTRAEVKHLEHVVAMQGAAAGSLGELAGNEVFSQRIRDQTREIKDTNRELRQQTRLMHKIERHFDHLGRRLRHGGNGNGHGHPHHQHPKRDADLVVRAHKNRQGRMTQALWAQLGPVSNW